MKRFLIILLILSITLTVYATYIGAGVTFVRPLHPQVNTVGLVAHWKLWNGLMTTGLVFDYSLNGNDGTLVDTDTPITLIPTYPGFNFDGDNDYIDTGDTFQSTFQGSFSISLWCKPDDGQPPSAGYFFGVSTVVPFENDCVWMVLNINGSLFFQYSSNGDRGRLYVNAGNPLFSDGQETWHHLVMVVDSTIRDVGGVKGYFDGVLQPIHAVLSRGDTTSVVSADFTLINNPYIGAECVDVPTLFYNGLIDDVMIFNKALTAVEVKNIYEVTRWRYSI